MTEKIRRESADETYAENEYEINAELMKPFDSESAEARVEQYYNQRMGEVLEARRKISEMFGIIEYGQPNPKRHATMDELIKSVRENPDIGPNTSLGGAEWYGSLKALIAAEDKIKADKEDGKTTLRQREAFERQKKVKALEEEISRIGR